MKAVSTVPVFRMFDEAAAKAFYVDFLGFTIDWEHRYGDNFPLYMQVTKDACVLHVSGHHGDCCPGGSARIEMSGVKEFSEALTRKDYKHAKPGWIKTEWNSIELSVKDPSGNKLIFWEPSPAGDA